MSHNKSWIYLMTGAVVEMLWTITLKKSDNFTQLFYSIVTVILIVLSFILFNKSCQVLPMSIAYCVFTGIGAVGSILLGSLIFHEPLSMMKILFSLLLIVGILLIKGSEKV